MSLANPIYLWSLLGLTVPLAIHLLSRKEGKIIKLGSIRHVQETSTQQFKGIRLNEILLLALRCLLIVILTLILSGLFFRGKTGKWILIEPGTEQNKNVQLSIDSLERQGYETRWLLNNFPSTGNSPDSSFYNYWFAIKQLQKQNLEDAIIFSFAKAEKFRGLQNSLPENIKVIPIEPREKRFLLEAIQSNDSIVLRWGTSNSSFTTYETKTVESVNDSIKVKQPRAISINLISDKKHAKERLILLAAIRAIDEATQDKLVVTEFKDNNPSQDKVNWLFWLVDAEPPSIHGNTLRWKPTPTNNLIEQSGKNTWVLTQPLTEETALKNNLTLMLASLLTSDSGRQQIALANDQRVLPETMAWRSNADKSDQTATINPQFPLFILGPFLLLLLTERYLSLRKNQ